MARPQAVDERSRKLGRLAEEWDAVHEPLDDPDDDPQLVRRSRKIMGLPPLDEGGQP